MLKKNGFTLAEVLLALGITGIIAAVTLPSLMLNVEKRKVGPALMKAVNTIESASTLALQVEEARKLSDIKKSNQGDQPLIGSILLDYTKLIKVPYNALVGTAPTGTSYSTKDGVVLFDNGAPTTKNGVKAYYVPVDTNGQRGPNKIGKDIFNLYVMMDGIVAPEGSLLFAEKFGGTTWETGCKSMTKTDKSTPSDVAACAGAIVDNGGRVLYNYEAIK